MKKEYKYKFKQRENVSMRQRCIPPSKQEVYQTLKGRHGSTNPDYSSDKITNQAEKSFTKIDCQTDKDKDLIICLFT